MKAKTNFKTEDLVQTIHVVTDQVRGLVDCAVEDIQTKYSTDDLSKYRCPNVITEAIEEVKKILADDLKLVEVHVFNRLRLLKDKITPLEVNVFGVKITTRTRPEGIDISTIVEIHLITEDISKSTSYPTQSTALNIDGEGKHFTHLYRPSSFDYNSWDVSK